MFAHFDDGVIHIHGNGRHLLEAVSTITRLNAIWPGDDIGFPPAFDILDELKKLTGDVPLILKKFLFIISLRSLKNMTFPEVFFTK